MRPRPLLLATAVLALAIAPAATASPPTRDITTQEDGIIADQCAFPVQVHFDGIEIDTTFSNKLFGFFPGNTVTLTNLDTGKAITLPATGSFQRRAEPDGSTSIAVLGHGLSPIIVNPITGDAGIWYLTGRLSVTLDMEGNPTSIDFSGKQVNLCAQLAT
jgi:hypothetical protein